MKRLALILCLGALATVGCTETETETFVVEPGVVVADFQSIADYLDSSVVQTLFLTMPRNEGAAPPDVSGRFSFSGTVTANVGPTNLVGETATAEFCFGASAGSRLEVRVLDPTAQDGGALSFVEGSGKLFTVYTAFKSVQLLEDGTTCELHLVNVYSGTIEADGSLSNLDVGQGIVGLIGSCGNSLVDDYQITLGTALRTGEGCSGGGGDPGTPGNVLVEVENNLVVDALVFIDAASTATISVPPLSIGSFEVAPGFTLDFETLQPIAGTDPDTGDDIYMGEIIGGFFPQDTTPADGAILYCLGNVIGDDRFFAPLPFNQSGTDIFSVVNIGVDIDFYPDPPGSGLDCLCAMPTDPDPYVVGYYSYELPGVIAANEANVSFFDAFDETTLIARFQGPFALEEDTGTCLGSGSGSIVLRVE